MEKDRCKYCKAWCKREKYFYQMYAYLTKYEDANAAILLYPSNEDIHNNGDQYLESWFLEDEQSKKIRVYNIGSG